MVGTGGLAVVADELEPADHLADGEEAEALSGDNAGRRELGVADAADEAAALGRLDELGRGLEEGAGAADGLPSALVEGLEGGHGAASPLVCVPGEEVRRSRGKPGEYVRRRHLLAAEDDLGDFYPDLGVVHHEGSLPCKTISNSILRSHHIPGVLELLIPSTGRCNTYSQ